MFPLHDANPRHGPSIIMWLLVAINVLVFGLELTLNEQEIFVFLSQFGFIPQEFFATPLPEATTLVTATFLHGGIAHIASNMIFLWIFGDNIEDRMGHGAFLVFYLLGGIVATLVHGLFDTTSASPMIGASGAVSAVLGAYIVIFPRQRILTFIPPFILPWLFIRPFARIPHLFLLWLPAWLFLGYWIVIQFVEAIMGLQMGNAEMSNVAWWAHIGGFIFGMLTARWFEKPRQTRVIPEV